MQDILDIGIDVAKNELLIDASSVSEYSGAIANTHSNIKHWLEHIPVNSRLAVESTGIHHRLLVALAQARGFEVYVLNACDVHYYAKALGQRGKTDRTDAQVICRYLHEHHAHLHPFVAHSAAQQEITLLLQRRERIVVHRDALRLSLRDLPNSMQTAPSLLEDFDALLAEIDQRIMERMGEEPSLADSGRLLRTIPGIGPLGSALLSCLFERIPFARSDAVVAFCGLDPRPMDSGTKRGRRKLSKRGASLLRRTLYMAGFAASRSLAFRSAYQTLRGRGLATTEAFIILARKILRIAFIVWKTKTAFEPSRLLQQGGLR